jgi:hypothetical protein
MALSPALLEALSAIWVRALPFFFSHPAAIFAASILKHEDMRIYSLAAIQASTFKSSVP